MTIKDTNIVLSSSYLKSFEKNLLTILSCCFKFSVSQSNITRQRDAVSTCQWPKDPRQILSTVPVSVCQAPDPHLSISLLRKSFSQLVDPTSALQVTPKFYDRIMKVSDGSDLILTQIKATTEGEEMCCLCGV